MPTVPELLTSLERHHIRQAVKRIDAGAQTSFSESTKFDVVFNGKRYPPKKVTELALEEAFQRVFGPSDFKGGTSSSAFLDLRRCGFTIVPKVGMSTPDSLKETIGEILSPQTQYSSDNTVKMKRRGFLLRVALRDLVYSHIEHLSRHFRQVVMNAQLKDVTAWSKSYIGVDSHL